MAMERGSNIYFSLGTVNARGVAILMLLKYNFEMKEFWKDKEARLLAVTLKAEEKNVLI